MLLLLATLPHLPPSESQPAVRHGGGGCATDWDCSLGGTCAAKKCECDVWFTGANCTYLNLQPAKPVNVRPAQPRSQGPLLASPV